MYSCSKFRVNTTITLLQKCNSGLCSPPRVYGGGGYERCGSSSLKRAGLSYSRERFDCNGLVFRILSSLPPTPSASQRLHLRAPTHNQVNRVFSLKKMRNRDALSFWGCGGTSDVVANRHTRHRSGQLRAVHFRADSAAPRIPTTACPRLFLVFLVSTLIEGSDISHS
jgi:hypothetical protein